MLRLDKDKFSPMRVESRQLSPSRSGASGASGSGYSPVTTKNMSYLNSSLQDFFRCSATKGELKQRKTHDKIENDLYLLDES